MYLEVSQKQELWLYLHGAGVTIFSRGYDVLYIGARKVKKGRKAPHITLLNLNYSKYKRMKKELVLVFTLFLLLNNVISQQNATPLYKGKADLENFTKRVLQKKISHWQGTILDTAKNRCNFSTLSFEISEKGKVENILFSRNYPSFLIDSITRLLLLSNENWVPAYVNGLPVRKRILQPIVYEQGNGCPFYVNESRNNPNYNFPLEFIIQSGFSFEKDPNSRFYIDAILLPVIYCSFVI